jgi:hypothetical protein
MQQKPRWWPLYAIFPISVGLLWLDGRLTLQPQAHQLLEIGIVLLSFGCMALWVRGQPTAPGKESAAHITYHVLPDPKCNQALDLGASVPDWRNRSQAEMGEHPSTLGKYN